MNVSFNQMPPSARAWVYTSSKILTSVEAHLLVERLTPFLAEWSSHGTPLKAACQVMDQAIVVVAVENGFEAASGCSIDKCVRLLKDLEQELQLSLLDRLRVVYKAFDLAPIQVWTLAEFKKRLATGEISTEGMVVDTQVATVGELKGNLWQGLKDSWLARFLPSTAV
jgi:hypothetical protein